MSIQITNPAEGFAAIAAVVIAADSVGSMEERDAVFARAQQLEAFKGLDKAGFGKLLGAVTGQLCEHLPLTDTGSFTPGAITSVTAAVRAVLSAAQRAEALKFAEALCKADSTSATEAPVLAQLTKELA